MAFWGSGNIDSHKDDGSLSLNQFIHLINTPDESRDKNWQNKWEEYITHIETHLEKQGVSKKTTRIGIKMLEIKLDFEKPNAIDYSNQELLNEVLKEVYSVELTSDEIKDLYIKLFEKVRKISNKPKQLWGEKSLSREKILDFVVKEIKDKNASGSRTQELTTQDKFSQVGLGDKTHYAFRSRINANGLKFEMGISSTDWENHKIQISTKYKNSAEKILK